MEKFIRLGRMAKIKIISNKVNRHDYNGDGCDLGDWTGLSRERYPGEVWYMAL